MTKWQQVMLLHPNKWVKIPGTSLKLKLADMRKMGPTLAANPEWEKEQIWVVEEIP